ncbi:MAG: hypothetical protein J6S85_09000 [Methanobrevibacter sp.]|nr:hypothetical protein [Methanobrevibacter sp.]
MSEEEIINAEQPKKRGRKANKKVEIVPNPKKVWVYFTNKSARGKDKVCLPYALAKKLEKGGQCKIVKGNE